MENEDKPEWTSFLFSFFFFLIFNGVVIFDAWDLNKGFFFCLFFLFFHLGSKLLSVYRLGRHFQVCIICENLELYAELH